MSELEPMRLPKNAEGAECKSLTSVALARLIDEVRHAGDGTITDLTAYNRTYHRHNR